MRQTANFEIIYVDDGSDDATYANLLSIAQSDYPQHEVKTPKNIYRELQSHVPKDAEIALVDFSEQFIWVLSIEATGYCSTNQAGLIPVLNPQVV